MRTHMVLVPGFGGFDALGQIRYYVGVTTALTAWCAAHPGVETCVHYFDNLPTASVDTRGQKLQRFIGDRIARRIIAPDDRLVLVGHSTGGLDIRWVVANAPQLAARIARVVFLSVPQRGCNIADWVAKHAIARHLMLWALRDGRVGLFDAILHAGIAALERHLDPKPQVFDAIDDATAESKPEGTALDKADARAAHAEIELWLTDIGDDFLAIRDLRSRELGDPAFADAARRFRDHRIAVRSYATIAPPPIPDANVPHVGLRSLREIAALRAPHAATDIVYHTAYLATASGPFETAAHALAWLPSLPREPRGAVAAWENDGIVNTASQWWPDGEVYLVAADHGDIIGHYALGAPDLHRPGGIAHSSYDLLGSQSGFDGAAFTAVWSDLFAFATSP